jgi:hypothetical protein
MEWKISWTYKTDCSGICHLAVLSNTILPLRRQKEYSCPYDCEGVWGAWGGVEKFAAPGESC